MPEFAREKTMSIRECPAFLIPASSSSSPKGAGIHQRSTFRFIQWAVGERPALEHSSVSEQVPGQRVISLTGTRINSLYFLGELPPW
jgi:hypothetical protein